MQTAREFARCHSSCHDGIAGIKFFQFLEKFSDLPDFYGCSMFGSEIICQLGRGFAGEFDQAHTYARNTSPLGKKQRVLSLSGNQGDWLARVEVFRQESGHDN